MAHRRSEEGMMGDKCVKHGISSMKPLKFCANGCGVPPEPPSKVICKDCQHKITETLRKLVEKTDKKTK